MSTKVILPGSTIGIIGGGQLGRMIALEAKKMAYKVICLDPSSNSPCGQVADEQLVAAFDNYEALVQLAKKSDVLLYEFENLDATLIAKLQESYPLPQKSRILEIAQDRIKEKTELAKAGFPVAPYEVVKNLKDLEKAIDTIKYPCILKRARGGYDGKGQFVIRTEKDLEAVRKVVGLVEVEWVLEKMIPFTHEVSVIVARNEKGEIATFPVAENIHKENILFATIVPARIPYEIEQEALRLATNIAHTLEIVGMLAIEFFVTKEGVLINETAPRPHNSGHFTLDACYTSQFEQILRAVCGLPLGSASLLTPVMMVNILGADLPKVIANITNFSKDIKIHLYGKGGKLEEKRKMGHLIIKTSEPEKALEKITSMLERD